MAAVSMMRSIRSMHATASSIISSLAAWSNHALQRTRRSVLRSLFFFISVLRSLFFFISVHLSAIQRRRPAGSLSLGR